MSLNSCFSQKEIYNLNIINMYIEDYNSKFEKLDTSFFTRLSPLSKMENKLLPEQVIFPFKKKNITLHNTGRNLYQFYKHSTINNTVELELEVNLSGGIYYREKIDELFYYGEIYYLNGNMRSKGITSRLGFSIDKGYKYDDDGNLIETIDYDDGYEFNYEKVLEFCAKNNIDILSKAGPQRNTILKVTLENGKKVWVINYHNIKTNKTDTYQLDGRTGKIIQKWLDKEVYGIKHY